MEINDDFVGSEPVRSCDTGALINSSAELYFKNQIASDMYNFVKAELNSVLNSVKDVQKPFFTAFKSAKLFSNVTTLL